jgi:hypothetical protein
MRGLLVLLLPLICTPWAGADGGVPIGSRVVHGVRVTLLMAPADARVGPVRFTLLGHEAGPVDIEVMAGDHRERTPLEPEAGRPGLHARLEFEQAGSAMVTVRAGAAEEPLLRVEVPVGPTGDAWTGQWPWLLAWVPMLALVLVREWRDRQRLHFAAQHGAAASE